MKGIKFIELECVYEELVCNDLIKRAQLFHYTERGYEYVVHDGKRYNMVSEQEIAFDRLVAGKGVVYRDKVYFIKERPSEQYIKIYGTEKSILNKEVKSISNEGHLFMDGLVFDYLEDKKNFGMVKMFIDLYQTTDLYSYEKMKSKLLNYLPEIIVEEILVGEEISMVG